MSAARRGESGRGVLEAAWAYLRPRAGGKKAVDRLVASSLRVPPLWAFGVRGLAEQGSVHAHSAPALACVCLAGALLVSQPHPRGVLCVSRRTTPLFPKNDPLFCPPVKMLFFPISDPESFAEQVSDVKLLDWGKGEGLKSLREDIWELEQLRACQDP